MVGNMRYLDVAKHWNENADQWTRDVRAGFDVYRDKFTFPAFLDALPEIDGLDVIDFGCGLNSKVDSGILSRHFCVAIASVFSSSR